MKIFLPFVIITLLIDKFFASWYSETFVKPVELLSFYVVIGLWAYARGHVAMQLFKQSTPVIMFSVIMFLSTMVCSVMAIITGTVLLMVEYELANQLVASFYYFSYNAFGYVAILLSIMEVISLFTRRIEVNGVGGRIADFVSLFYALPRLDSNKRVEV